MLPIRYPERSADYVCKSQGAQHGNDTVCPACFHEPLQLFKWDLDAGKILMCPHPQLREAEGTKECFRLLHPPEGFYGQRLSIGNARGETGAGRFLPGGKAVFFRKGADFRLGKPYFLQWAYDLKLSDRFCAGR